MADAQAMTIPEQAVQAAAKIICAHDNEQWGDSGSPDMYYDLVGKMLTAAAPYMQGSSREHALDLSVLERMAEKAEEFDVPDDLGPYPDIQDAMVTVGDLRKLRKLLAAIRALSTEPAQGNTKPVDVAAVLITTLDRTYYRLESIIDFIERHCSGENATCKRNIALSIQAETHEALSSIGHKFAGKPDDSTLSAAPTSEKDHTTLVQGGGNE